MSGINRIHRQDRNYEKRFVKVPHRKKNVKPRITVPKTIKEQKALVKTVKIIAKKIGLKPAKEVGTGVDFYFTIKKGKTLIRIPIDFKFSFGSHFGAEFIKVRVTPKDNGPRQLINTSKWTMVVDEKKVVTFFRTKAIKEYVSKFWGRINKTHQIDKIGYVEYPVNISDMLYQTGEKPIQVSLNSRDILNALKEIEKTELPKDEPKTFPKTKVINKNGNGRKTIIKPTINRKGTRHK